MRQLWTERRSLAAAAAKTIVHSYIINRIDDCNMLYWMQAVHIDLCTHYRVRNVLNSTARVVLTISKFQHNHRSCPRSAPLAACKTTCGVQAASVIRVYKVLRQTAPPYLADMCQPVLTSSTRCHLRSAAHGDFVKLRSMTMRYGKRSLPAPV